MKIVWFDFRTRFTELQQALKDFPGVILAPAPDAATLRGALPGAEVLIVSNRIYTPEHAAIIREHGKALRWLQFSTSGIDKGVASGLPAGVIVTNAAGLRAFAVAEHAFALMLGLLRQVAVTERARPSQVWVRDTVTPAMENLAGKHLVIVGLGAIGQEIARKAKAFDMAVTGVSRASGPFTHVDRIRPRSELKAAAAEADILLLAATADAETENILSRAVIQEMKPSTYVINIARGQLVDEPALIDALRAGKVAGAGLDVTVTEPLPAGHPFWSLPNVLLTPHVAGAGSQGSAEGFTKIFLENLRRWLKKDSLKNVVVERTK